MAILLAIRILLVSMLFAPCVVGQHEQCLAEGLHDAQHWEQLRSLERRGSNLQEVNIDMWFHLILAPDDVGLVNKKIIDDQYDVLHETYSPYGVHLTLAGTTLSVDKDWAGNVNRSDLAMQRHLRQGDYATLNIYFQSRMSKNPDDPHTAQVLGFSAMPKFNISNDLMSDDFWGDGCNVHAGSMPGGWVRGNNQGFSAVHEVGHWLGLLHTFDGGSCEGPGDYIDDTPQQSESTIGCPASKNSCPDAPGEDPIHNYMDYSSDDCYSEFTFGQQKRMLHSYTFIRGGDDHWS